MLINPPVNSKIFEGTAVVQPQFEVEPCEGNGVCVSEGQGGDWVLAEVQPEEDRRTLPKNFANGQHKLISLFLLPFDNPSFLVLALEHPHHVLVLEHFHLLFALQGFLAALLS